MFVKLLDYGQKNPKEVLEINGVRVCCLPEFCIGKGDDGTRVYVGLGKDGYERAVKCLYKDTCVSIAEHEKNILNIPNIKQAKNVIRYYSFDDQSNKKFLFFILDLCEETLENYVKRKTLDQLTKDAPEIIRQVLKGLAELHGKTTILHRDLKPANILRNIDDKWLLADFGISRVLTEGARTHRSMQRGTRDWKAVESCTDETQSADDQACYKKESDIQVRFINN